MAELDKNSPVAIIQMAEAEKQGNGSDPAPSSENSCHCRLSVVRKIIKICTCRSGPLGPLFQAVLPRPVLRHKELPE